jgi:uncharacterized protein (DUF1501 family)
MRTPMNRRDFLKTLGASSALSLSPTLWAATAIRPYERLLVLIELKGGNDGLNTVVPYADPAYAALRPRIGIRREEVVHLSEQIGFHPSLLPLLPVWQAGELALIQGVGYPGPNLSHFRSIEIWDTASKSDETLQEGWLARAFQRMPPPNTFAANGVVIGSSEMGPLTTGSRVVTLTDPEKFMRQARLADTGAPHGNGALAHILKVEADIRQAASGLKAGAAPFAFATDFPTHGFGATVKTAAQVLGSGAGAAVLRLTLGGFDTHQQQAGVHGNLLKQLAEGLVALRSALMELNLWERTLVLSYAEFGRRPKENQSGGTDHGTANVHFAFGGQVRGGLYGQAPDLTRLDGNGNSGFSVDYRQLYATVLARWWGLAARDSRDVLGGPFAPLGFVV